MYLLYHKYFVNNNEILVRKMFADPSQINWIELELDIDVDKWMEESNAVEQYYVAHRGSENHSGWESCCLHGLAIDKTNSYQHYQEYDNGYNWTELTNLVPTITQFWKNFPAESYKRIRFMKLKAGGYIDLHRDCDPKDLQNFDPFQNDLALNVAITQPKECIMNVSNKPVPWKPGMGILLNVSKEHEVFNNSNQDRIHMIAHFKVGKYKKEFSDLLCRNSK